LHRKDFARNNWSTQTENISKKKDPASIEKNVPQTKTRFQPRANIQTLFRRVFSVSKAEKQPAVAKRVCARFCATPIPANNGRGYKANCNLLLNGTALNCYEQDKQHGAS